MATKPAAGVPAEAANVVEECVKLADCIPSKKNPKEPRKADKKSADVLSSLNNLSSAEEKLSTLCKKYSEIADESKKMQVSSKHWEKKCVQIQREKDQIQSEFNKTILLKSKLESLCRELQRQIKTVKEESMLKIKEEEERRKETLAMFQNTISEVTAAMEQNNEKNSKLRDDNLDMTEKFKSVMEQYELREHQVDKITKQMALETQLSEAKLAKANLEAQAEKEKLLAEKKQLLVELTRYQALCNDLQTAEVALRSQIAMYTDKYDEFQNALTKSNEVFGGFKGEMEKMSKKVLKQEKEAGAWKQRWEKSHAALLEMATEKQQADAACALHTRQLMQLQKLCRTMQAERTVLLNTLQENNIERPPLPQLPPEPKLRSEGIDKVDLMAANCAELKQSLSQLQGQLNDLTSKKGLDGILPKPNETPETVNQNQKKSKKGKGKKSKPNQNENVESNATETPANLNNHVVNNGIIDGLVIPPSCPLSIHFSNQLDKISNVPKENITPDINAEVNAMNIINDSNEAKITNNESCVPTPVTNGVSSQESPLSEPLVCELAKPVDSNVAIASELPAV